jgi:protein-tyrosine phosphatase
LTVEAAATSANSRVLEWDGCLNVRDLGGLRTSDGHRVQWGALVRSDLLCRLTDTGRSAPVAHGIRTIIDVRFPDEVAHDWDFYPFRDDAAAEAGVGPRYVNVPFNSHRAPIEDEGHHAKYDSAQSRGELNRLDLDTNQRGVAAIVAAIADAQPGGVLVHCHAGKDRTGIVVAVVLSLLGVADDDIAEDYALTMASFEPLIVEWLDHMSGDLAERDRLRQLATPSGEAMLEMLAHLAAVYVSAESYLQAGGLADDQVARLRGRLLE